MLALCNDNVIFMSGARWAAHGLRRFSSVKHFTSWPGLCLRNKISGRKVLSSATKPCANRAAQALRKATQVHKESWSDSAPCHRMKVRLKKEIVTMGVPGISPTTGAGSYVKPQDWNALISDPDVVVVDTRNDYEVAIGTFAGALDPGIKTFSELPAWAAQAPALQAREGKNPRSPCFAPAASAAKNPPPCCAPRALRKCFTWKAAF